jgi:hypothetical protein
MPVGEEAAPAISWAGGSHRPERWRYDDGLRPAGLARTISGEHTRRNGDFEADKARYRGLASVALTPLTRPSEAMVRCHVSGCLV